MKLFRGGAALAAALVCAGLLAACDGSRNPFNPGPGGGSGGGRAGADSTRPQVDIQRPTPGNVAVGDSVFVRARVSDNTALASVTVEGFAVRGSPTLGTDVRVTRFTTKTVDLTAAGRAVTDTTIQRFLLATPDTLPESGVLIVVTARDTANNTASDTVRINLGGPRISLSAGDTAYVAGSNLSVRVSASDPHDLLSSVLVTGSGAFAFERRFQFASARPSFDTTLVIPIPASARNQLQLTASTVSGGNLTATAGPVAVRVREPEQDRVAPKVTFQTQIADRVEQQDSFSVQVSAVDETGVDSVGVTVAVVRRDGLPADTIHFYVGRGQVQGGTFRFGYAALGLDPYQTAEVDLEVTAWATDKAGNCGAATRENTPQDQPCTAAAGGVRLSTLGSGRLVRVFVARGQTLPRPGPTGSDLVADLVADSGFLYLSNFTRNRVELLPLGSTQYGRPVPVGSQPWGLALGRFRDSLYVANSGGTNISVIPLGGAVLNEAEGSRIFTRNERLFGVVYDPESDEVTQVTLHDYSDRPQFLAQASNGLLVYSTRPTPAAEDGTVRIFNPRNPARSDIFIGYVDRHTAGRGIVVNADSSFLIPPASVMVCPRARLNVPERPECIVGGARTVSDSLTKLRALPPPGPGTGRFDTRLDLGADIRDVGFADTTFVAASTDRRFVGVGEGVRENARIPLFEAVGDSMLMRGDVRDLISNTAERVIGLGINRDGTLGVARGNQAYFFNSQLRLQGVMESGAPSGGVAMHPENGNYPTSSSLRLSFVSGLENGRPYIDVLNTFNFFRMRRIYLRDPVVGALVVAPRAPGDPANVNLRLYGLTTRGVLSLTVTHADVQ